MENVKIQDINDIFIQRTGIDFGESSKKRDEDLLGIALNVQPRELVLIYMDLQKRYDIKFPENEICNKQFNSFNNIFTLVEKLVAKNKETKEEKK